MNDYRDNMVKLMCDNPHHEVVPKIMGNLEEGQVSQLGEAKLDKYTIQGERVLYYSEDYDNLVGMAIERDIQPYHKVLNKEQLQSMGEDLVDRMDWKDAIVVELWEE